MTNMREFAGVTTEDLGLKLEDLFEEVYSDSDVIIYESKETFEHEEEGMDFKYKYMIHALDMYEATGDEDMFGKAFVELQLAILPESICDEEVKSIAYSYGYEDKSLEEIKDIIGARDVLEQGLGIRMGMIELDTDSDDVLSSEEALEAFKDIVATFKVIDDMRGFYLDRPWNMIGSTGWDTINQCLNGTNQISSALDRLDV